MPQIAITRSRYPQQPGRDTNRLYSQLFDEAQYLHRSRGSYKGIVERQRTHIAELQGELQQFSDDMALSLQQKAELNKTFWGMQTLSASWRKLEAPWKMHSSKMVPGDCSLYPHLLKPFEHLFRPSALPSIKQRK